MTSSQHVRSLYRTYLRQVSALPHAYLRLFFRLKAGDDFRLVLKTKSIELRRRKLKRVSKDLRRLRAANGGEFTAFDRMLDIAYGRVGKLRRELMEPLLSDGNPPIPSLTDSRKDKTRLPTYSPELAALLTSGISHTTRALQKHHLFSPPGLPERLTSNSEDIMLLGTLGKRREYNIRWRFFKREWKKVYPPLQVSPQHHPTHQSNAHISSNHPLSFGFQNTVALRELFVLAGSPSRLPDPPRKQMALQQIQNTSEASLFDGNLPVRWLRRRYQALLGRVPLLTPRPTPQDSKRTYDIQLAENAITTSRTHLSRLRVVDAKDVSWISDVYRTLHPKRHNK